MDKKPGKLVPEVRFKGFTDDWEQHKLENVFTKYQKRINPTQQNLELWSLTIDQGLVAKTKRYDRSFLVRKNDIFNLVPKGYFVYNPMNITLGTIDVNKYHSIAVSGYYIVLKSNDQFNVAFLASLLHTSSMINKYKRFSTGSLLEKQRLQFPNFAKVKIISPRLSEQTKIGLLMNQVNNLIDLQQRKLEQLKQLKKAMLQQLFIDKKSKQPNLRFKIFNGDWEQRKFLDEIDSIIDYRGKTPKKLGMSWSKTGYLALSALNVKNGWIDKKSKDSHFGSQALYDIWMKNTPLYKDQVVFTTEAPMGNVAQIPDNEKYILSQRTIAFNPSQRLIDGFLADLLSTKNIQNKLMSLATGGTAKGVSQKSLKFLKIAFPSNEEQNFIHKVIKLFQILITLQQTKLTQLTTLKKYLLQNLFI